MSDFNHSCAQDVVEQPEILKDKVSEEELKPAFLGTQIGLSTQVSTVSNTSERSLCCEICNIKVTSSKILQRHLEGRKHKSRAERQGKTFYCDICDVTANSEIQLNIHLTSSKHKTKVAKEECKVFLDMSSYSTSLYIFIFALFCIVVNLIILVKVSI
ncbi:zinc finger protein 385B-like [Anthonomus grandis grandis]|uniref:zinc finger protein 385B-like n=1 Tax=Anthonomus grandis grandis TaxID=2921223 RepID=UPI002165DF89|nr:zinc finger protein 385B-like [Anthonomus grandis grandis]